MAKNEYTTKKYNNGFPSHYVPNLEKQSDDYAKRVFRAILDSTSRYREARMTQVRDSRMYARGEQSLQQYLDELSIEGNKQYVNISYTPSKLLQKFEKVIIDKFQQLEEKPKAIGKAYFLQERKERRKANLRFRMQYSDLIDTIQQQVGFPIEDPNQRVPEDEDELDLIMSLNSEEREELLMNMMLKKVLSDNDIDSLKRLFLSDTFQTNFGGIRHYTDNRGKIKIRYVAPEDAISSSSMNEGFTDITFAGSMTNMTIGELRYMFQIPADKEEELWKLARRYKSDFDNYPFLSDRFNYDWRKTSTRPYDDFTVPVQHLWYKTVKNVGYTEGTDSYGKRTFDVDKDITEVEYKSNNRKRTGVVYPETAYEGWFAGDLSCPVVLEWKEQPNQIRSGSNKATVECPYIFFMPDNRGTMREMSAVERVIPDIQVMDSQMLQIKLALANHPPAGYAVDYESLMDVDLGTGEDLQPVDIKSIYQQTGILYYKRKKEDGSIDYQPPIIPINISIADKINTHLSVYNIALSNVRDTLGVNQTADGTANLSRVSTTNAQNSLAVSETATYYIYRAFIKAMERLIRHLGIRLMDILTYGSPDRGYLKYLGEENLDFLKERQSIVDVETYEFKYNSQMTAEDRQRVQQYTQAGISQGSLTVADALLIDNINDSDIAEKYLRYLFNKNKKEAQEQAKMMQREQMEGQAQIVERGEQEKQKTIQIQSDLQAREWEIKGKYQTETKILDIGIAVMQARLNGQPIPPEYSQLERLILDNALTKQEQSLSETEQEVEAQVQMEQQQQIVQQYEQAVQNGDITPEEAQQELSQMNMGV